MTKDQKQRRYDTAYMRMALEWAKLSHCKRKQVGSLIVKDRMIISDGYNGAPTGFDPIVVKMKTITNWYVLHAEANAIMKVACIHPVLCRCNTLHYPIALPAMQ